MGYAKTSRGHHWVMKRGPRVFIITEFPNLPGEWYWFERGQETVHGPYLTKREIVQRLGRKVPLRLKAPEGEASLTLAEAS